LFCIAANHAKTNYCSKIIEPKGGKKYKKQEGNILAIAKPEKKVK
jgi:ribosomal protein L24E